MSLYKLYTHPQFFFSFLLAARWYDFVINCNTDIIITLNEGVVNSNEPHKCVERVLIQKADLTQVMFFALNYTLIEFYLYPAGFLLAVLTCFVSDDATNSPKHASNDVTTSLHFSPPFLESILWYHHFTIIVNVK